MLLVVEFDWLDYARSLSEWVKQMMGVLMTIAVVKLRCREEKREELLAMLRSENGLVKTREFDGC